MSSRRLIVAVLVLAAAAAAPARAASVQPPSPVTLKSGWTFTPAGGAPRPVTLPHVFDPRPLPQFFRGTTGTYRLTLTPPALPPGFTWGLRFEQVRRVATVTLNGAPLGVHRDPYVPFTLLAPGLHPGQPNALVVDVDNRKGAEPREGWWNWGGITRPVELVPIGPVELHAPALLPQVRCDAGGAHCSARVRIDGWVENRTSAPATPQVTVRLAAPGGGATTTFTTTPGRLAPGQTRRLTATFAVPEPDLWSPDHPALYDATITTRSGVTTAQVDHFRTGLRSVGVRAGHLVLNGRRVDLRGASVMEDMPGHGAALTNRDMDEIVRELKAVHANVTRAHYLLNDRLLARLDAAGILVWQQAPIYHRDVLLRTPAGRADALATLRGTVLAARSHPSILTFSVANEPSSTPDQVPTTRDYLLAARNLVRDLDPGQPVSVDILGYPGVPYERTWRAFDLLGLNNYFGWYPGRAGRETARFASLRPYLRLMHRRYPAQALVMTEFGAEATRNGPATQKQTYAFQSRYLLDTLGVVKRTGFMDGAIYWTLREFAVKPHWDGLESHPRPGIATDSIHNKGLIAYDGRPKPAFAVAAKAFASTPLYVTGPSASPLTFGRLLIAAAALLALLAVGAFDVLAFRALRRPAPPEVILRLRRRRWRVREPESAALWRELDGDDITVAHDVVAAFET